MIIQHSNWIHDQRNINKTTCVLRRHQAPQLTQNGIFSSRCQDFLFVEILSHFLVFRASRHGAQTIPVNPVYNYSILMKSYIAHDLEKLTIFNF